jgi:branched-chain amino acid transport system substrate-binding protein
MKTKRIFFAAFGSILWFASGLSYAQQEVKVGVLIPLSGGLAVIGENLHMAHDFAVKEINEAGGIKSLKGAKIKLIYADTRGDSKIGMSEAERLILREGVVAIMGAFQSSVSYTSTEVAEKHQVPYLVPNSLMDAITERGFKYTFRVERKGSLWAKDQIDFIVDMGKATGKPAKTIGVVYENTDMGQTIAKGIRKYAPEKGLTIALDEGYPQRTADMTPVVLKMKRADPDVIILNSYISDAILLIRTIADQRVNPIAFLGSSSGYSDPSFIKEVGKLAEYFSDLTEWSTDLTHTPLVQEKNAAYKKWNKDHRDFNGGAAFCYASTYILYEALEKAASYDPKRIRDAFAAVKITKGPAMLIPWTPIQFDSEGQAEGARMIVVQYREGLRRTIWPFPIQTIKPIWPVPKWEERK